MVRHTGEQWAVEAGEDPGLRWCPSCREWVAEESDVDEDGSYSDWCPFCGGDVEDEPEAEEPDDIPVG